MSDPIVAIAAVLDILSPMHGDSGERYPIFEWPHEETPAYEELYSLAEEIVKVVREVS